MVKSRRDWGGESTWENKFKMFSVLKTYQCKAGGGGEGGGGGGAGHVGGVFLCLLALG